MDRSNRQEISKKMVELNITINQLYTIDVYGLLHPTMADYTFFVSSRGSLIKIDHFLGQKTCLNKCKRRETTQYLPLDQNRIKLELNNRKITGQF